MPYLAKVSCISRPCVLRACQSGRIPVRRSSGRNTVVVLSQNICCFTPMLFRSYLSDDIFIWARLTHITVWIH